jgi:hypothetical protein
MSWTQRKMGVDSHARSGMLTHRNRNRMKGRGILGGPRVRRQWKIERLEETA